MSKHELHSSPDALRRALLTGSASAGVMAFLPSAWAQGAPRPLPAYASFKDAGAMIVHSSNTLETRRAAMGGTITPLSQLYVRNNLNPPDASVVANPDVWQVEVSGVRRPRSFTVGELKKMGVETVAMVLQCSGNGRGFIPSKPSGTPWQVGAAGCVMWTGVPLRNVAKALGGVNRQAKYITGTGGEVLPAGVDIKTRVERSVPVSATAGVGNQWPADPAGPRRAAATDRARLQRREQRQVPQAVGIHRGAERLQHPADQLPHDAGQRKVVPCERPRCVGDAAQVLRYRAAA